MDYSKSSFRIEDDDDEIQVHPDEPYPSSANQHHHASSVSVTPSWRLNNAHDNASGPNPSSVLFQEDESDIHHPSSHHKQKTYQLKHSRVYTISLIVLYIPFVIFAPLWFLHFLQWIFIMSSVTSALFACISYGLVGGGLILGALHRFPLQYRFSDDDRTLYVDTYGQKLGLPLHALFTRFYSVRLSDAVRIRTFDSACDSAVLLSFLPNTFSNMNSGFVHIETSSFCAEACDLVLTPFDKESFVQHLQRAVALSSDQKQRSNSNNSKIKYRSSHRRAASAAAKSNEDMALEISDGVKLCSRCRMQFVVAANDDSSACRYHPGTFESGRFSKGWSCCKRQAKGSPGCKLGYHVSFALPSPTPDQPQQQPQDVAAAAAAAASASASQSHFMYSEYTDSDSEDFLVIETKPTRRKPMSPNNNSGPRAGRVLSGSEAEDDEDSEEFEPRRRARHNSSNKSSRSSSVTRNSSNNNHHHGFSLDEIVADDVVPRSPPPPPSEDILLQIEDDSSAGVGLSASVDVVEQPASLSVSVAPPPPSSSVIIEVPSIPPNVPVPALSRLREILRTRFMHSEAQLTEEEANQVVESSGCLNGLMFTYLVQDGDTLRKLFFKFNVSVDTIKQANSFLFTSATAALFPSVKSLQIPLTEKTLASEEQLLPLLPEIALAVPQHLRHALYDSSAIEEENYAQEDEQQRYQEEHQVVVEADLLEGFSDSIHEQQQQQSQYQSDLLNMDSSPDSFFDADDSPPQEEDVDYASQSSSIRPGSVQSSMYASAQSDANQSPSESMQDDEEQQDTPLNAQDQLSLIASLAFGNEENK